ncbi:filamentation induced by cAMP protein Fic [Candidatus Halobonum tyrrellensis G22]|uniref:Filamentation induced by cAMP protein Fic n=1 Tax=Candidatus Halobonum tyrrellensis G22 TaxID=1324957 RepID=V4GW00_9EURY|nr:filamentation induced by cAMP protein Fic [Candidatus Halobonum tyrrellensis G22]
MEGIGDETETSPLLYTTMVRREAVESVVLEGADIELEDVFRTRELGGGGTVQKDVQEALNYERTISEGADRVTEGGEISLALIRELHRMLMDGVRGHCEHPGEFRAKPMNLPPASAFSEPFVPPAPNRIPELMANLEEYVNTNSSYHDLLEFAIVHYQFETVHPFEDGNGRLGRILITLQLVQRGYLTRPLLYPSAYFNQHKIEYANRMREVSEYGEWLPWLRFFVEGIRTQAAEAVERTSELRDLRREYERRYGREKTAADRLAMRLFKRPYVTANDVADLLAVSGQTARNAISELVDQDVLVETTGKQRYQEFKAVDIFEVLSRPMDSA